MIIDKWLGRSTTAGERPVKITPIRREDIPELHFGWNSHYSPASVADHITRHPNFAWRAAGTSEYIIGEWWRRRQDIACITELRGKRYNSQLVDHLLQIYRQMGITMVVLSNSELEENGRFYRDYGFVTLEKLMYYEKPDVHLSQTRRELQIRPFSTTDLTKIEMVDHAAFPWFWWNSIDELRYYAALPDVHIFVTGHLGQMVGYVGYTMYERWGHLDRIAVDPRFQGQGFGAAQLHFAISRMAEHGARRITLSTQTGNQTSQRLYENFGFHRNRENYDIVGINLDKHFNPSTQPPPNSGNKADQA